MSIATIHVPDGLDVEVKKKMKELGFKNYSAFAQAAFRLLVGQDKQSYGFMCQYREGSFKVEPGMFIHLVILDRLAKENSDLETKTIDNLFYVNQKRDLVTGQLFYETRKKIYEALRDKVAGVRKQLVQLRADAASEQVLTTIEKKTIKERVLCE